MPATLDITQLGKTVKEALDGKIKFCLYAQPLVSLESSNKILGYELLARLPYQGQIIMPADFLPIVDKWGLSAKFDKLILNCVDELLSSKPEAAMLAFNLSATGLLDHEVLARVLDLESHLNPMRIVVELTESQVVTSIELAQEALHRLHDAGFQIALDDFGVGFSSLSYIAHLPVDVIKFDRSLAGLPTRILSTLANALVEEGYSLVAEGIEDEGQAGIMRQAGFAYAQGYLFGRPAPADRLVYNPKEPLNGSVALLDETQIVGK